MIGVSIEVSCPARRNDRRWRCAVAVAVAIAVGIALPDGAARAQTSTAERQAAQLAAAQKLFEDTIAAAERTCLSNHAKNQTAQLTVNLPTPVDGVEFGVRIAKKTVEV